MAKIKALKSKIWSTKKADIEFSKFIRDRDKKCLRCGTTERLTCSHFWGRRVSDLRYEPDNCIALCAWKCHLQGWEKEKHGAYRDFMIDRLGLTRYEELRAIYYKPQMKRKEAIEKLMAFLSPMKCEPCGHSIREV